MQEESKLRPILGYSGYLYDPENNTVVVEKTGEVIPMVEHEFASSGKYPTFHIPGHFATHADIGAYVIICRAMVHNPDPTVYIRTRCKDGDRYNLDPSNLEWVKSNVKVDPPRISSSTTDFKNGFKYAMKLASNWLSNELIDTNVSKEMGYTATWMERHPTDIRSSSFYTKNELLSAFKKEVVLPDKLEVKGPVIPVKILSADGSKEQNTTE